MALINTRPLLRLLQRRRFLLLVFSLSFTYCMVSLIRQGKGGLGGGGGSGSGAGGGMAGPRSIRDSGAPRVHLGDYGGGGGGGSGGERTIGLTGGSDHQSGGQYSGQRGGLLAFLGRTFGGGGGGGGGASDGYHPPNSPKKIHRQEVMVESDEMQLDAGNALQIHRQRLIQHLLSTHDTANEIPHDEISKTSTHNHHGLEAEDVSPKRCRNSVQGRVLIADDQGYVCYRKDLVTSTGCCPSSGAPSLHSQNSVRYTCDTCEATGCCAMYEYCVSCCLGPDKRPLLAAMIDSWSKPSTAMESLGHQDLVDNNHSTQDDPSLAHGLLLTQVTDHFELCLAKCRTSSLSVRHENSYRDPKAKHCYISHVDQSKSPSPPLSSAVSSTPHPVQQSLSNQNPAPAGVPPVIPPPLPSPMASSSSSSSSSHLVAQSQPEETHPNSFDIDPQNHPQSQGEPPPPPPPPPPPVLRTL